MNVSDFIEGKGLRGRVLPVIGQYPQRLESVPEPALEWACRERGRSRVMPGVELSWSAAEVKHSKLTVPLEGDVPKGWKKSFEATVLLLGRGDWGEIQLKRGSVQVSDVEPGSEEKLRHHLESVVAQANADHEPEESEEEAPDADEPESETTDDDDGPDAEMTQRFRSF
jgi:hypothetical protein